MSQDIKYLASHLTQMELINLLRGCGHDVVFAPVYDVTPDGDHFVWHKPFIDEKSCLEAVDNYYKDRSY